MSSSTKSQGLFGRFRDAVRPQQSDCCSVGFEAVEAEVRTGAAEAPRPAGAATSSVAPCCGAAAAVAPDRADSGGRR